VELPDYVALAKRNLVLLLALPLLFGALGYGLTAQQERKWSATASVLLRPNDPSERLDPGIQLNTISSDKLVQAQPGVVKSGSVLTVASEAITAANPLGSTLTLKKLEKAIEALASADSNIMTIKVTTNDPTLSRDAANLVADAYIENRRLSSVEGTDRALDELAKQLDEITADLKTIGAKADTPQREAELATAQDQYRQLNERNIALTIERNLKQGEAELINDAIVPEKPVNPNSVQAAILGMMVGLVLAGFAVLVRDRLDPKLRTRVEAERLTGLPVLAEIPTTRAWRRKPMLAVYSQPGSQGAEAFRTLRVALQFLGASQPMQVVLITSAIPADGKSTVSANLAASLAESGESTLLLGADLRRGSESFGVARGDGLAAALSTNKAVDPVIGSKSRSETPRTLRSRNRLASHSVSEHKNMWVLTAETTIPQPVEVLRSRAMENLVKQSRQEFNFTVIDTPPVTAVTDAVVMAQHADGVILTAAVGHTPRDAMVRALQILRANDLNVIGIVLNRTTTTSNRYYHVDDDRRSRIGLGSAARRLLDRVGRDDRAPSEDVIHRIG
jgi:Mrp family chromosome partitioning ATPase/capsular polysaccharide biosynthesis protein